MPERAPRYPEVDALRAFAAIAVLGTHAAIFAGADYPGSEVGRYAQRLEVGLTIFFVISGFLLYRPFVAARVRSASGPRVAAYAWRRLLRIAPAYWVALTSPPLLVGKHEVFTADGAPAYYLLGQTYSSATLSGRAHAGLDAVRGDRVLRLPAGLGVGDGRIARRLAARGAGGARGARAGLGGLEGAPCWPARTRTRS